MRGPTWKPNIHDPILRSFIEQGLSVYAIADRMKFNHQTVERHIRCITSAEPPKPAKPVWDAQAEATHRYQLRKAQENAPAVSVIPWEFARGKDEPPVNYANRVLKNVGKLPVVGMIYAERIRRANLELKARGYPQITDRLEWRV